LGICLEQNNAVFYEICDFCKRRGLCHKKSKC